MSEIALYEALKQIPNITDEQAKAAVADVAKKEGVATKSDLIRIEEAIKQMATKTDIARLDTDIKYLRWFIALGFSITVAILKLL